MEVTQVTKTQKQRFSIFVDDQFFTALHMDVYAASGLTVGSQVTEEELLDLQAASQKKITRDRAYRLLSARQYSKKKLTEKLLEYAEPEICAETVQLMEDLKLIHDQSYAQALARDLFRIKKFSRNRIRQDLTRKGFDRDTVQEALEQFDWEEEDGRAEEIIRRRMRGSLDDVKERNRLAGYLARMGYSYDKIHIALRHVAEECSSLE